jgi:hypothetical protein
MATAATVTAIGPGADVEHGAVLETRGHACGIFQRALIAIEFEGPIFLEPFPNLEDMDEIAVEVGKGMAREVGDGDGRAEPFMSAINDQLPAHQ